MFALKSRHRQVVTLCPTYRNQLHPLLMVISLRCLDVFFLGETWPEFFVLTLESEPEYGFAGCFFGCLLCILESEPEKSIVFFIVVNHKDINSILCEYGFVVFVFGCL